MTEFLIIVAVIDVIVFVALFAVMKAGRQSDLASQAQARTAWATRERVRRDSPLQSPHATRFAGRRVFDSQGSLIGQSGELLVDSLDGSPSWLEVRARGLGSSRLVHIPADGLRVGGSEIRVPFSREHILRAPGVLPGPIGREAEMTLCRHYGMSRRASELLRRPAGEVTAVGAGAERGIAASA